MVPAARRLRRRVRPLIHQAAATPGADRYRKHFPARAHLQPVGAIPTVHVVVAGVAREAVGAAPAEDGVGPAAAGDGVLAFSADEAVPSAVTINIVRQSATPPVVDNASIAATATS